MYPRRGVKPVGGNGLPVGGVMCGNIVFLMSLCIL